MSRIDKLIERFKNVPKDFTWSEPIKILVHFGYHEIGKKRKTGGSRVKFSNSCKEIICLHKSHPRNIVKQYVIRQVLEKLNL